MITFTALDPATDTEPLVAFLARNTFPFHRRTRATDQQTRETVLGGRFWSHDSVGFWIEAESTRVGIAVIDDLTDSAEPKASVAYAVLRRDWASGTTTAVQWDDL